MPPLFPFQSSPYARIGEALCREIVLEPLQIKQPSRVSFSRCFTSRVAGIWVLAVSIQTIARDKHRMLKAYFGVKRLVRIQSTNALFESSNRAHYLAAH